MAVHEKHSTNQHQKQYKHLTVFERGQIKALRDAGWTIRAIARCLHRSPSTISRELKRGSVTQMTSEYQTYTVYFPETAQIRYKWERQKCRKPNQRPKPVNDRLEVGHWEIDTVLGRQKESNVLLTLTERKTRMERIYLIEGKKADCVNQVIEQLKKELGDGFTRQFRSITADNGSEFARLEEVLEGSGCDVYYAHPYSAWERGSNERHNGLIRRMVPKGKSMDGLDIEMVAEIEKWCNTYPRKILDYRTPEECLSAELDKAENESAC